ncbi:MAG: LuxR C-terminal-related transcriptional regulator [Syntrophomonadaceae bacterium]|nr:LuxR C-terminal-related transcriptional regulator [Syntrophomonadaceae bacterium]
MISRAIKLFPYIKRRLESLGFENVDVTSEEKDSLNMLINEKKPSLVLVGSGFYKAGTPYMTGRLLKLFPDLTIAALNTSDFPDDLAVWFIWHGVKSYVNLLEGYEEFHQGLQEVRNGKEYIAPQVQKLMDDFSEWPETYDDVTKRQMEVLIMICNGYIPENIGDTLQISRRTVNWHLRDLYNIFHVKNREELVKVAFSLKLVTEKDLVFHDREHFNSPLPAWAAAKKKIERSFFNNAD